MEAYQEGVYHGTGMVPMHMALALARVLENGPGHSILALSREAPRYLFISELLIRRFPGAFL